MAVDTKAEIADLQNRLADLKTIATQALEETDGWPAAQREGKPDYAVYHARFLRKMGDVAFYQKHAPEALRLYREAYSVLETAARRWPDQPVILFGLMQTSYDVGTTLDDLNARPEALVALKNAVEAGQRLVRIDDLDQSLRRSFDMARGSYAEALNDAGRPAEAVPEQQAVIDDRQTLASLHPGVAQYARDVAFSRTVLASMKWKSDRAAACELARAARAGFEDLASRGALTAWDKDDIANKANRMASQCVAPGRN